MAFYQKRIVGPTTLGTTASSITVPVSSSYEVPVGSTVIIKQIIVTNITASSKTVTIWVVPANTSAADSHIIFHDLLINANETTLINMSLVMSEGNPDGDKLYARASAVSAVNMTISAVDEDAT